MNVLNYTTTSFNRNPRSALTHRFRLTKWIKGSWGEQNDSLYRNLTWRNVIMKNLLWILWNVVLPGFGLILLIGSGFSFHKILKILDLNMSCIFWRKTLYALNLKNSWTTTTKVQNFPFWLFEMVANSACYFDKYEDKRKSNDYEFKTSLTYLQNEVLES